MGTNDYGLQPSLIQTFVFLDLETSGLFPEDRFNPLNSPRLPGDANRDTARLLSNFILTTSTRDAPRVTEISALSVPRNQIINAIESANLPIEENDSLFGSQLAHPIVRLPCNVHTRQINPELMEAEWTEYELKRTRNKVFNYSRQHLIDKNNFATEWQGVKMFLEQMPKPVCILAHNGIKFDFRVLHAEFSRTGLIRSNPFPAETYFVDSFIMFMDLEKQLHDELRSLTQAVDWRRVTNLLMKPVPSLLWTSTAQLRHQEPCSGSRGFYEKTNITDGLEGPLAIQEDVRSRQYVTPTKKPSEYRAASEPVRSVSRTPKRKLRFETTEDHPLQFARMSNWSPARKIRLLPKFFQRTANGDWQFDNHVALQYFTDKGAFRLEEMYRQLTNREFDAHFAQDDCEALLQVCLAYGREFVNYVDAHAAKFPF